MVTASLLQPMMNFMRAMVKTILISFNFVKFMTSIMILTEYELS